MDFQDIAYAVGRRGRRHHPEPAGVPQRPELPDAGRDRRGLRPGPRADEAVRVVVVRGSGGVFSTGHDLGTPEGMAYREALGATARASRPTTSSRSTTSTCC